MTFPRTAWMVSKRKAKKNHFVYTHDDKKKETRFLQSNLFFILPEMKYIFFCNIP